MFCFMFLIIMMVLLIMILIVSIILNSDSVLMEIFNYCIMVKVFISDIGIVISGMMDVFQVCRNSIIISIISRIVFSKVVIIVLMEL